MKRLAIIITFFLFSGALMSQHSAVRINISDIKTINDSLCIECQLVNDSVLGLAFLKPDASLVCAYVYLISITEIENSKEFNVYPCTDILDLDCIISDYKNTTYLNTHETFSNNIYIERDYIRFLKPEKWYDFQIIYELTDTNVQTKIDNIFRGCIISNIVRVKYK